MVILPEIPRVRLRFYKSYYRCDAKQQNPKICQDLPGICKDSARNLPGTSWSTIASTHLPHIHPPRNANEVSDRQDPKRGGGADATDFYDVLLNNSFAIDVCVQR